MPSTYSKIIGGRYETGLNGRVRCVKPGRTTWRSDWPADAQLQVAHLTRALRAIAAGCADPKEAARAALEDV